ncbi:hypothetical protein NB231_06875 [Nitrococcus mobilis Nb-231]|uniref:Uncharacterized protein n=1 Tax=Nitrococcus mobilis Nb-231 TaxID=314278 RepID=A4BVA9_9GAMM|nr:hypothetical protein NB231_06875 [Nitrococcus mobilis Nb-231]
MGITTGRGKLDGHCRTLRPKKTIWVYPLHRRFQQLLCQ